MAMAWIAHRNVTVVAKTGVGKSTVAKKLLGEDVFKVSSSLDVESWVILHMYSEVSFHHESKMNQVKVVDTIGLFNRRLRNKDTIAELNKYFKDIFPDGINLLFFVS